jgi:hypothetical protein
MAGARNADGLAFTALHAPDRLDRFLSQVLAR